MTMYCTERYRKARKKHRCEYCGRWINPGDIYMNYFCTDGSDWWTGNLHIGCNNIMQDECRRCGEHDSECFSSDCFTNAISNSGCARFCDKHENCKDNPFECSKVWEYIDKEYGKPRND